jgi:hypothetical protein
MKTGRLMLVMIAVCAVLALAWNVPGPGTVPSSDPGVIERGSAAAAAKPTLTPTPEPTEEPEGKEGVPDLSMEGLKKLQSFRSEMKVTWEGKKSGKPVEGYITITYAMVHEPPAYEMHIKSSGLEDLGAQEGQNYEVSFVQVGKQMWFYNAEDDSWMQMPAGDMDVEEGYFGFSPAEMLPGFGESITKRRSATTETVNGVECYKYSFTEEDMEKDEDMGEVTSASGEAWVAAEGEYVVKFSLEADISASPNDEMFDEGTVTMDYEIFDINQPFTIEPPAEALGQSVGREDIPMLPDAEVEFSTPMMISYKTESSVTEAGKFYKDEMPKNGWKLDEGGETTLEDMVILNYAKDGDKAYVMISKDEATAATSVMITIESKEAGKESEQGTKIGEEGEMTGGEEAVNVTERADIPLLADAEVGYSTGELVSYTTKSTIAQATKFYETEMPKNGWKAAEDGKITAEDSALLGFTKGGESAYVIIGADEATKGTSVTITIEAAKSGEAESTEEAEPTETKMQDDIPVMPDAEMSSDSEEGYIVYTTSASLDKIEAFYEKEMPARGWEPETDNDLAGNGYLDYSKDDGKDVVNIYVAEEDGKATVEIFVTHLE